MCNAEGPDNLTCIMEAGHGENEMHMARKNTGALKYWSHDWKPNPNRLTWRS